MSVYPTSIDSFSTKRFKQDVNKSADMNAVQEAIVAIENELGTNPSGTQTDVKTLLQRCLATNGAMRNGTSFPASPNAWDFFYRSDLLKMYVWDGSSWNAVSDIEDYAAGDVLLASSDTARDLGSTPPTTFTKIKSIQVVRLGVLRIKFTLEYLSGAGGSSVSAQIFRNGSAVGTIRTRNFGDLGAVEYSEDISGWNVGDECQIYLKQAGGCSSGPVTNFRIYALVPTVETLIYDAAAS